MPTDRYVSPLSERYASKEMQYIFSPDMKFRTWRKLWIALAEVEHELGLKQITQEMIDELKEHADDINYDVAKAREKEVRHDVMSHVYAYGVQCPKAKGIIGIENNKPDAIELMTKVASSYAGIEAAGKWIEETYGIRLEIQFRPGGAEGENYVRTLLAAGEMADLCYFNAGALLATINPAEFFVDLTGDELIANVSHDLRTPLTMISGYAEVMRDIPGENTPENVQIVIDEANRLTGIVNDLLDLSKLQAGALTLTVSEFNLTEDIRNTLHRYDKLADFSFPFTYDRTVYVCADQLKISQVLYNLVNNAINYSGGNKTVYIDQTVTESTVRVSIRDTGEGIPADKLQYIWDRYYKVDKEHKRAQVGTGLGLSIVKKILDLHGGRYGVASVEGKGSTFWFELPVLRTESLILPEPPTLPEQKADAERDE